MRDEDFYWEGIQGFVKKSIIILDLEVEVIGYFPYHTASIKRYKTNLHNIFFPREFFKTFEEKLANAGLRDNKVVYICKPYKNRITYATFDSFAIFMKDSWALVGRWESVRDYDGNSLKKITKSKIKK